MDPSTKGDDDAGVEPTGQPREGGVMLGVATTKAFSIPTVMPQTARVNFNAVNSNLKGKINDS
jgi:hypothetical protein